MEPKAPMNSPVVPTNYCREPKDVLVSIHSTFKWPLKMQSGSLENSLISRQMNPFTVNNYIYKTIKCL